MSIPLWLIFVSPTLLGMLFGIIGEFVSKVPSMPDKKPALRPEPSSSLHTGMDNFLDHALATVTDNKFNALVALVLLVFSTVGVISWTIGVAAAAIWIILVLWIWKIRFIQKRPPLFRFAMIVGIAGLLGYGCYAFRSWSFRQYLANRPKSDKTQPQNGGHDAGDSSHKDNPTSPPQIAKGCVISPNAGAGGPSYKHICDLQLAQWVIDEANKVEDLIDDLDVEARAIQYTPSEVTDYFHRRFEACCRQGLSELRTEVLARLGPTAQDADEISNWKEVVPDPPRVFPSPPGFSFKARQPEPSFQRREVEEYLPYLRKLGVHLKRTVVPREEPKTLRYTMQIFPTAGRIPRFPKQIVDTATISVPIKAGYVLAEFNSGPVTGFIDFRRAHSMYDERVLDNRDFLDRLDALTFSPRPDKRFYCVRIGSIPVSSKNPLRVIFEGPSNMDNLDLTITLFDE